MNRVAAPQIRQSFNMSPAKSSLSHVVIQQRQIVPPPIPSSQQSTTPHKPSTTNLPPNRTSSVVMPPTSKSADIATKHIDNDGVTNTPPCSLVNTQMPQTPKQIVFETKMPQKSDIKEDKPSKSPLPMEKLAENNKPDDVPAATTSVIKSILSKSTEQEVKVKEDESDSSSAWTAKEVNIESVIKVVDELCTDDETNIESKVIVKPEPIKVENVEENVEKNDAKDSGKSDAKSQPKREKITRNKKTQQAELEVQKSPPSALPTIDLQSGVQTRRGVTTKQAPVVVQQQPKRGRNNRNASPRSKAGASQPIAGNEKPRSNNSESDIYEFHEDSGEETIGMQSNDAPRTRALSFSKPNTQPSSPVTQPPTESNKPQTQPAHSANEPEPKSVQTSEIEKPNETATSQDEAKDDLAALNNLRKSRRLIERDGSRSTVDDTIEDVVKNISKEQQSVITTSATVVQTTSTQAQPRRSTRNTTNQMAVKLTVNEKTELRKSPRPTRSGAKEIKTSETESTAVAADDNKSEDAQRGDEKRDNDSEATQSATESSEIPRIESHKPEPVTVVEEPKKAAHPVVKELLAIDPEKRQSGEPMTLIDPVTGEMTVVQEKNEGQYVPVHGGHKQPSVLVTSREIRPIAGETIPTTSAIVSKVSNAPVMTIVSKSIPIPIPISVPIPTTAATQPPVHVQKSTVVITSKAIEPPSHNVPLSMSIEKTLAPQPQIQIQPIVQTQAAPIPAQQQPPPQQQAPPQSHPHSHSMKSHVMSSPHVKVSQAQVISSTGTPVILSTSVPSMSHMSNVQPVIKSTTIIQSNVTQPNIQSHKYGGKDSPATVIAQQPQYPPKIQVSVAQQLPPQQQQSQPPPSHLQTAHKNTLIVNIPSSSPANLPAHSPRHSPNISAKVTYSQASIHESPYSIHVPKHSVANIHPPQILSQKPLVIHPNKMHMPPTSSNYTSVVQCSGKVIQTPPPHHLPQPTPLVQMGPSQPIPMQHMSQQQQQQQPKPSSAHQISIQSTQSAPFVGNVPLQVRTSTAKYESAPSPKLRQHILPPNIQQIQTPPPSIVQQQQQQMVAKQSTFPPQSIPPSNQIRLHQNSQIMTGAVASPPPKQPHLSSQQPIVAGKSRKIQWKIENGHRFMLDFLYKTGASSSRVSVPPLSPQGQQSRPHSVQQPGLPVPGFEANLVSTC